MMPDVRNLKQAVMPIIWLNCIFCMGIFEIPINRPRYFLSVFYAISILIGYFALFYKEFYIFQEEFIQEFMVFYVVLGINVLVAMVTIILFWWKTETMNNTIKRHSIVDSTLEALGIKAENQKIFRNVLGMIAMWTVGMILIILTYVGWIWYQDIGYWTIFCSSISMCFPILINCVVDLTFASFIRCVQIKFQKTNTVISNIVLCANESNAFKTHNQNDNTALAMATYKDNNDKMMHHIQTIRHLHLEITRIGQQISCTYCLQLLFESAVHFTMITSTTYCLYGVFSGQLRVTVSNGKIISMAVAACVFSFKIIFVNWLCTSVSTEACRTAEILQSFEGSIINDDMREEIRQFTQQIILNSLNFTAAGFFTINNSLTGKFFATVTTYVVILIQMNTSI
ncbi:PREDICTED: putative gustatory receptor 28b isoform X1 [Vollenhovia emeryi]|nr:PREDICTED: putative gustatory receptor 28b isoform X1 [Vollenhovia emeryi]